MTSIRHLARQRAMQFLYGLEYGMPGDEEEYLAAERRFLSSDPTHRRGWGPFARELARNTFDKREELDKAIGPMLHNWRIERLPILDRVCLRLALCELRTFNDIPLRVTINEYIELVRNFSTEESTQYVNAVLDKLAREFPDKDFKTETARETAPRPRHKRGGKAEPKPEPKIKPRIDPRQEMKSKKDEAQNHD